MIVAGEAKSHCVAWTIQHLLDGFVGIDRKLVRNVYLLEDCTSPVVVPGVVDYTDAADEAFARFAEGRGAPGEGERSDRALAAGEFERVGRRVGLNLDSSYLRNCMIEGDPQGPH